MLAIIILAATLGGIVDPRAETGVVTNTGQVLIVSNPAATRAFAPQFQPIRQMVREGITRFTSRPGPTEAW